VPDGAPLSRATLHNALRRLNAGGERNSTRPITPEKIRAAFLWRDPALAKTPRALRAVYFAFEPAGSELACSLKESFLGDEGTRANLSYEQAAHALNVGLPALKTLMHRFASGMRSSCAKRLNAPCQSRRRSTPRCTRSAKRSLPLTVAFGYRLPDGGAYGLSSLWHALPRRRGRFGLSRFGLRRPTRHQYQHLIGADLGHWKHLTSWIENE
jgi:hypothetical protein